MTGTFDRVDHFRRHIFFIVLGEHFARREGAVLTSRPERHDSLTFPEQIGQDARVIHRNGILAVGDDEMDLKAGVALDAALLDQSADAENHAGRHGLGDEIAWAPEELRVLAERIKGEASRAASSQEERNRESQALLFLGGHVRSGRDRINLHCIAKAGQRREKVNFSRGLPGTSSRLAPAISRSYQWRAVDADAPGMVLRGIVAFVVLAVLAFFSFSWAHETRLTWFDTKPVLAAAAKYDATVVRDRFGVPHISGRRDADAAFGLAYAHAEDDLISVQRAVLAARGRLATVDGVRATNDDYLVQLLGIWDDIAKRYQTDLSPDTRALLDGYAAGLNLYAAQHRGDVLAGFAPAKAQDVVALFMLRLPFFYGLDNQLRALIAGGSAKIAGDNSQERGVAIAVAPIRSADGATRLLINPQAPFGGPLSWYEAQISSGEGWDLAGGLIPGSPVMLAGAGPNSGWGISPSRPDLSDIYTLEANPNDRYFYRYDNEWRRLETRDARLVARLWGPVRITLRREILRSGQGPVIRNRSGLYAVRYAGLSNLKGIEAFFRVNKARDFDAFTAALGAGDIPGLNFVYAEKNGRIAAIYNGAFPDRPSGYDWSRAVPGNVSATLWNTYLPSSATPRTVAPTSGFVIAADGSPFRATADPFNPKPASFPASQGIEAGITNRARRPVALFSADKPITAEKFRA